MRLLEQLLLNGSNKIDIFIDNSNSTKHVYDIPI